ncbi:MAG: small nuclear ribonucleoprotein [Candidatus Micrarchaeota archaeon]|nr:small nuclear ribonucleoprotein [Candidatus Micrarchaeota archaeon]
MRPVDVLDKAKEKRVLIKLKNGSEITGKLRAFDLHLNIWLDDAEETRDEKKIRYGSVLIRGDTVVLVSPGEGDV